MNNLTVPLLALKGVALGYGSQRVLEGLDVEIARAAYVGIVGPNGSGKTTLLKAILGIHPPLAGEVRWGGAAGLRPHIGYVPQRDAIDPLFPFTAIDVVLLPLTALRSVWSARDRRERAAAIDRAHVALERVGLMSVARQRYSSLSGGQRQRILMARALVTEPELLVLDEPTSGMDLGSTSRILDLVGALRSERHLTVLLVSHDLTLVAQRAESVLLLHEKGYLYGSTNDVVSPKALTALYGDGVSVVDVGARRIVIPSSSTVTSPAT